MADRYPLQQQGVIDGTKVPADKADGRQVNATKFSILASKPAGTAWANGDVVHLGRKPAGQKIVAIRCTTGTSFGTSTLSVGVAGTAAKYVSAGTLTAPNVPTNLGPLASTLDDDPGAAEDLILTIGTADIAAATVATFEIEMVGIG